MGKLTADQCEEIFHAALRSGDVRGVEASLRFLAVMDPHRAATLFDLTRFALDVARRGAEGAPITEGQARRSPSVPDTEEGT